MDKDRYHSEEFIEQYLQGELSEGELQAFETYLTTDAELSRIVALRKAILEGISDQGEEELMQEVDKLFAQSAAYDLDDVCL